MKKTLATAVALAFTVPALASDNEEGPEFKGLYAMVKDNAQAISMVKDACEDANKIITEAGSPKSLTASYNEAEKRCTFYAIDPVTETHITFELMALSDGQIEQSTMKGDSGSTAQLPAESAIKKAADFVSYHIGIEGREKLATPATPSVE
jgi:hypothetical protein